MPSSILQPPGRGGAVGVAVLLLVWATAGCTSTPARIDRPHQDTHAADAASAGDSDSAVAENNRGDTQPALVDPVSARSVEPEQAAEPETRRSLLSRVFRRSTDGDGATPVSRSADPPDAVTLTDAAEAPLVQRYELRPGDEIRLEVFREPELSGNFRLTRPDGLIRHPLLGDVVLKGMTVNEAEAYVHRRLAADFLVNPRVILQLAREPEPPRPREELEPQVLVMGQVRRPGAVTFARGERLTLLEAIALAGGFTNVASRNRVLLVREVDGRRERIRVRVDDVLEGKPGHHNIELKPGDTISVPEVWF